MKKELINRMFEIAYKDPRVTNAVDYDERNGEEVSGVYYPALSLFTPLSTDDIICYTLENLPEEAKEITGVEDLESYEAFEAFEKALEEDPELEASLYEQHEAVYDYYAFVYTVYNSYDSEDTFFNYDDVEL